VGGAELDVQLRDDVVDETHRVIECLDRRPVGGVDQEDDIGLTVATCVMRCGGRAKQIYDVIL